MQVYSCVLRTSEDLFIDKSFPNEQHWVQTNVIAFYVNNDRFQQRKRPETIDFNATQFYSTLVMFNATWTPSFICLLLKFQLQT